MSVEIVPLTEELLPDAAQLLAQRHRQNRCTHPEMAPRFEDPAHAQRAVAAAWKRPHASGFAALRQGRLIGYLFGDIQLETPWERSGWVRLAGYALAPGESLETLGDLYQPLGAAWVGFGCFAHFAMMPTADPALLDYWFRLCFGAEHIYALATLERCDLMIPPLPPGIAIRRADANDRAIITEHYRTTRFHLTQSPVWGVAMPEQEKYTRDGYAEIMDDPEALVWLAFDGERSVGIQAQFPPEQIEDDLLTPDRCMELCVASVLESHRRLGIATALTRTGYAHIREAGAEYCLTDWRSTNLNAARCWVRQGFRPMAYRLVRRIDSRIAWANGKLGFPERESLD